MQVIFRQGFSFSVYLVDIIIKHYNYEGIHCIQPSSEMKTYGKLKILNKI